MEGSAGETTLKQKNLIVETEKPKRAENPKRTRTEGYAGGAIGQGGPAGPHPSTDFRTQGTVNWGRAQRPKKGVSKKTEVCKIITRKPLGGGGTGGGGGKIEGFLFWPKAQGKKILPEALGSEARFLSRVANEKVGELGDRLFLEKVTKSLLGLKVLEWTNAQVPSAILKENDPRSTVRGGNEKLCLSEASRGAHGERVNEMSLSKVRSGGSAEFFHVPIHGDSSGAKNKRIRETKGGGQLIIKNVLGTSRGHGPFWTCKNKKIRRMVRELGHDRKSIKKAS